MIIIYNEKPDLIESISCQWIKDTVYVYSDDSTADTLYELWNEVYRWPEAEKYFANDPYIAYFYAVGTKERFPAAEPILLKSPIFATHYACDVIKGRWPEAEPGILEEWEAAYLYSANVIKGRWPEAELTLLASPNYAIKYATHIIKGRWPELENIIRTKSALAAEYAMHVLKDRWIEAEPYMIANTLSVNMYERHFGISSMWK